jgi:GNAT superfamily N-acetyltransferase
MASKLQVREVQGRAERGLFIDLPWKLYRDDPMWVPPLKASVRALLDSGRHPFYAGGADAEITLLLAWEGHDVVGRIAAIANHAYDRFHDERCVFFGFFESIERPDVAKALLRGVEEWARQRGAQVVRGPMNPSTNYECGLLVEGFNRPPVLMMTYNPAYYQRLIEAQGFAKAKDLYAYISPIHDANLDRLARLAERTRQRNPGLETRPVNLADFASEVRLVQEIYNSAWERNWGFVPMNDAEIDALAKDLKPLVQPDLVRFALVDGDAAGFLLALPDWNPVLRDLDGSVWRHPVRALRHLLWTKPEDMQGLRLITMGVKEQYRKRGIEGVLFVEGIREGLRLGYEWCEYSWILEDNELTKRAVRSMEGELYKVYRVYEKTVQ